MVNRVKNAQTAAGAVSLVSAPPLPPHASAGRRWRFRRDLVIYVASTKGISQRVLADVFDLPRSRIAAILKDVESRGHTTNED